MELATRTQLYAALELAARPGVGAARFKSLIDQYGSPLAAAAQLPPARTNPRGKKSWSQAELSHALDFAPEVAATYYGACDYPPLLRQCPEPPPYLFWQGSTWPIIPPLVAIVGARDCSAAGRLFAEELASGLAAQGVGIVSGGARGIDAAAHFGALHAGGAPILVAASGIDVVYPPENLGLFRQVQEHGCIVTELLPGTPPRRDFFPTRNRIMVGLAQALVVIEGQTGSWSSAQHALRLGRPIFTWASSPQSELRRIPNLLVAKGAVAIANSDPDLILNMIGLLTKTNAETTPAFGNCMIGKPSEISLT